MNFSKIVKYVGVKQVGISTNNRRQLYAHFERFNGSKTSGDNETMEFINDLMGIASNIANQTV